MCLGIFTSETRKEFLIHSYPFLLPHPVHRAGTGRGVGIGSSGRGLGPAGRPAACRADRPGRALSGFLRTWPRLVPKLSRGHATEGGRPRRHRRSGGAGPRAQVEGSPTTARPREVHFHAARSNSRSRTRQQHGEPGHGTVRGAPRRARMRQGRVDERGEVMRLASCCFPIEWRGRDEVRWRGSCRQWLARALGGRRARARVAHRGIPPNGWHASMWADSSSILGRLLADLAHGPRTKIVKL